MKNLAIILGSIIGLTIVVSLIVAILLYNSIDEEEFSRASVQNTNHGIVTTAAEIVS